MNTLRSHWKALVDYGQCLRDQSSYWRIQAAGIGMGLVILICASLLIVILTLHSVFGGGNVHYNAKGSPGPVVFRHYSHMWFNNGKYKDCKVCHEKLFASQKYGTYVIRALADSPPAKIRIGRDASTLMVLGRNDLKEELLTTYEVPRACATCATGACHDGKESFSRFDCLGCHQRN